MKENPKESFAFGGNHFQRVHDISLDDVLQEISVRKDARAENYFLSRGRLSSAAPAQFWEEGCGVVLTYLEDLAQLQD